jgi:hypothetical protein
MCAEATTGETRRSGRPIRIMAGCSVALLLLPGCTTALSGVAAGPPGVNVYSFRECLLDKGFYSQHVLTGIALQDWKDLHEAGGPVGTSLNKPMPSRAAILEQNPAVFVARASTIIADGLMPGQEYAGEERAMSAVPAAGAAPVVFDDGRVNLPYRLLADPGPYPVGKDGITAPTSRDPALGRVGHPDWRLNRFLDCYIGPVGPASEAAGVALDDDDDIEGRLLRAHILLTLLTEYGMELVVSHPGSRQVGQAEFLLGHVVEAETALRSASLIMTPATRQAFEAPGRTALVTMQDDKGVDLADQDGKVVERVAGKVKLDKTGEAVTGTLRTLTVTDPRGVWQPTLRWKGYATRLLRVFQVGVDDERIDATQTLERATNLVAAFSGSIAGFLPLLKDGLSGAVAVQKTRLYGDAYLRDARETLLDARSATSVVSGHAAFRYEVGAFQDGWANWDKELTSSCAVLATIAKKDNVACVPKSAKDGAGAAL